MDIEATRELTVRSENMYSAGHILGRARVVLNWKVVEYCGLALFTVLVPRLMGPGHYGRFAAVMSLTIMLSNVSSLGGMAAFARFVPQYAALGEWPKIRALFVQVFWTRAAVAGLAALLFVAFVPAAMRGVWVWTPWAAAAALVLGSVASTCYQFFFGLNLLGRSRTQEAILRPLLLVLLLAFGAWHDLDRAILALLGTQLGLFTLGLFWTRDHFKAPRTPFALPFLASHLSFGMLFFLASLLLTLIWRMGETALLVLSHDADQAGFFSIANAAVMALDLLILQSAGIVGPTMTARHVTGDEENVTRLAAHSLKYLTIVAFGSLLVLHGFADVRDVVRRQRAEPLGADEPARAVASPTLEAVLAAVLRLYAESRGKVRGGDKTPEHHLYLDEILEKLPAGGGAARAGAAAVGRGWPAPVLRVQCRALAPGVRALATDAAGSGALPAFRHAALRRPVTRS